MGCGASASTDRASAKTADHVVDGVPVLPSGTSASTADVDASAAPEKKIGSTKEEATTVQDVSHENGNHASADAVAEEKAAEEVVAKAAAAGSEKALGNEASTDGAEKANPEAPEKEEEKVEQEASPPAPAFRFSLSAVPAVSAYQASDWEETGGEEQVEKEIERVEKSCEKIEQEMVRRRSSIRANPLDEDARRTSLSSNEVRHRNFNPEEWPQPGEESSDEEEDPAAESGQGAEGGDKAAETGEAEQKVPLEKAAEEPKDAPKEDG